MAKQRKTIGATQKAKVALEAIKEQSTVRELSTKYKIHTTQIHSWKKKLIAEAPELFDRFSQRAGALIVQVQDFVDVFGKHRASFERRESRSSPLQRRGSNR